MKNKTKSYLKYTLIGILISGIIFGTLSVYAAITFPSNDISFDSSNSALKSTNIQNAIDELYKKCTTGGTILENAPIITSGDGLYEDEYEPGKYIFKGRNPNNYITFNGENAGWRILSVEADGTIKIIRNESIGNMSWSSLRDWKNNNEYYNEIEENSKKQIISSNFNVGEVERDNNDMLMQVNSENSTKWNGMVAIPTLSEYIRTNSDIFNCGTVYTFNENYSRCMSTGWIDNNAEMWTITAMLNANVNVYMVNLSGKIVYAVSNYGATSGVRPVVYLSSSIKLSGNGTISSPYQISL